jgi:hypothetical protein
MGTKRLIDVFLAHRDGKELDRWVLGQDLGQRGGEAFALPAADLDGLELVFERASPPLVQAADGAVQQRFLAIGMTAAARVKCRLESPLW